MDKWLSIVGIGEDRLEGVAPIGRSLINQAEVLVGGDRHLAMVPNDSRPRIRWSSPIDDSIQKLLTYRGQAVCVLASGDPMCYGIGVTLSRRIAIDEMTIIPALSAFSLACSRLGWSMSEVETLSLCGRDPALLNAVLYPNAKILVLSADRQTPAKVAQMLCNRGLANSSILVLEHLGGTKERILSGTAGDWNHTNIADLNTIAIICSSALLPSRSPGIPDFIYQHDGQLTKREVRAVTLSTLAPQPGQLLWDVGAGCGSIAIEWMRSDRRCHAVAIESNVDRLKLIAQNANMLGVPNLRIVAGKAPIALQDLPQPDTIFIGGGLTVPDVVDTCWRSLCAGGRLVANAVTVETEAQLFHWHSQLGGELTRIAVQRAEPVGKFLGWKAMAPITQWCVIKDVD
ncbi:bifunctional cobalt-precorrin-7 (C(5))-methyltransferase/cobalt-precorrin-6B (C(15))-methyltransferase [Leptolyngbya sp. NIES-2104]|uniref:bifunctional cobalt-precorrin-7 (C(5))-methyltransferase/cobalt-precorrin-6B (C(15))-methyltransferase n=1 Tax=Leptolyngbya sp. NIES-2104 TaxID=1552121 RepID=UPI0006EC4E76|nr:bifunctional cobalt-precorrin-7 (C(5))-methyltransferase/cobalt-precorrin-6B (C(15))-methyltransferase [Leptolyngbya sp. NIES-2104]GAP93813.1 cobalt-precorrin-6y C5-methyltransferase / Cobalt-precorrin-6y C15-methyltransferase [Leptolyngbya sp. NIES-2104]